MKKIAVEHSLADHSTDKYLPLLIREIRDICIFFLTSDGHIASWSGACDYVKEYEREEIIGKHYRILFPERLQKQQIPEKELETAVANGKAINYDWRRKKSGEEFWAYVILTPLFDDNKKHLGFAKITQDLSKEYFIKKELLANNLKLNEFAYTAAHDLKAPLRHIKTLTDILSEDADCLKKEQQETLSLLNSTVGKMAGRIDDILKFAKSSVTEKECVEIDLIQLIKEVVEFVKPGHKVRVNISPDLPRLRVPATALFQIFQNLIDNAIKYNDKDFTIIDIGMELKEDGFHFIISDNGPGIRESDFENIFDLFQRQGDNTSEGSGIGLALVKRMVTSIGGKIWVTSELKKGSTFHFTIPAIKS